LNAVGQNPSVSAADSGEITLEASLEIADVVEARRRLLDALVGVRRFVIDVRPLTAVDTAGVQLLLAVAQECKRRGIEFSCRGESPPLACALRALGLSGALEQGGR
jgi:anti-anti-sigma regulatory factor